MTLNLEELKDAEDVMIEIEHFSTNFEMGANLVVNWSLISGG